MFYSEWYNGFCGIQIGNLRPLKDDTRNRVEVGVDLKSEASTET